MEIEKARGRTVHAAFLFKSIATFMSSQVADGNKAKPLSIAAAAGLVWHDSDWRTDTLLPPGPHLSMLSPAKLLQTADIVPMTMTQEPQQDVIAPAAEPLETSSSEFVCDWEGCGMDCLTLKDLVIHVNAHVADLPWGNK